MEKVNEVFPRKEMSSNWLLVAALFWGGSGIRATVLDFWESWDPSNGSRFLGKLWDPRNGSRFLGKLWDPRNGSGFLGKLWDPSNGYRFLGKLWDPRNGSGFLGSCGIRETVLDFWGSSGIRETVLDSLTTWVSVCFPKRTVFQIPALLALCVPNYIKKAIRILDGPSDCRMQASVGLFHRNSVSFSLLGKDKYWAHWGLRSHDYTTQAARSWLFTSQMSLLYCPLARQASRGSRW